MCRNGKRKNEKGNMNVRVGTMRAASALFTVVGSCVLRPKNTKQQTQYNVTLGAASGNSKQSGR